MKKNSGIRAGGFFYHATRPETVASIKRYGFRADGLDLGDYKCWSGGNLGHGIYVTSDPQVARVFGAILLVVKLSPGTRILDASGPIDRKAIRSLRREFGHEILTRPPAKWLPKGKRLRLSELVALVRYHYAQTWERAKARRCSRQTLWHQRFLSRWRTLNRYRSLLIRYGFHGYGEPSDENGIVVFSGDRVLLVGQAGFPQASERDKNGHASGGKQRP